MKGVIVAAGYGTRFLPITRAVPKEMLPLVDRPSIDYIIEEFVQAGISEILVISSRRKKVMEDWFDTDKELESVFLREGAEAKLSKLQPIPAQVYFVRQKEMKGTGHALLLAKSFVGDEAFVVAFPDDLFGQPNCTAQLIAQHEKTGASVLSAHDFSGRDVSRYGVIQMRPDGVFAEGIIEKPSPGQTNSSLVSLGRYLYTAELFAELERQLALHTEGEFYATEAINSLAQAGRVAVQVVDAPRYDTGTPLGYLQTSVDFALARDDLGPAFKAWLLDRVKAL